MKADKKTQEKTSVPLKKRLTNNHTAADSTAMELQSPLEIPGIYCVMRSNFGALQSWGDAVNRSSKTFLK